MQFLKPLLLAMLVSGIISCSQESSSPSGYRHVYHTQTNTPSPDAGDRVYFHCDIFHADRLVETSRKKGEPATLVLRPLPSVSPIEEALHYMRVGDSMSVFVQIDTLYKSYDLDAHQSYLEYRIKLLGVAPTDAATAEQTASK